MNRAKSNKSFAVWAWAQDHKYVVSKDVQDAFGLTCKTASSVLQHLTERGSMIKEAPKQKGGTRVCRFFPTKLDPSRKEDKEPVTITPCVMFDVPGQEIRRVYFECLPIVRLAA